MKIYKNTEHPKLSGDSVKFPEEGQHSVDVITYDENGMINTAWYDYDDEAWKFHGDTLVDPYEGGELFDFAWIYAPEELLNSVTMK